MGIGVKPTGNTNVFLTPEGGLAVKMLNKTGAGSIKGYICETSDIVDNATKYVTDDDVDPMGIMYSDGVADGDYVWVVVSGIAEVYYSDTVTRATFARVPIAADSIASGQAKSEPLPTSPFATDKHFLEIGHPMESRIGAGLARTVLHFN